MGFWEVVFMFFIVFFIASALRVLESVLLAKLQRDNVKKIVDDVIAKIYRGFLKFNLRKGE